MNRHSHWIAIFVLATDIIGATWGWYVAREYEIESDRQRFRMQVEKAKISIAKRMLDHELILRSVHGLFLADNMLVSRSEWRAFVENLRLSENFPGIQGVGFSKAIQPKDKETWTAAFRAEGNPNFRIWPEGDRELYTSIIYLEPFIKRNLRAFGYDMYSEPVRKVAMRLSQDSGLPVISGKVRLVQETETDIQNGILMYFPVYENNAPIETVEDRRKALIGWVYSPYRMNDLMGGILGHSIPNIDLEIYDGTRVDTASFLFAVDGTSHIEGSQAPSEQTLTATMDIYGRTWTVYFSALPSFYSGSDRSKSALVLIVGLAITFIIGAHIMYENIQNARMAERERQYRLLFDDNPHPMFIFDPESLLILEVNKSAVEIYGYSREEFLRRTMKDIRPSEEVAKFMKHLGTLQSMNLGAGSFKKQGARHLRKDGTLLDVETVFSPTLFRGKLAIHTQVTDVTASRRTEGLMKRMASILEATSDLVGMADRDGGAIYLNAAGRRMLGLGSEEDLSKTSVFDYHPPEANEFLSREAIPAANRDGLWSGEIDFLSRDGRIIPMLMVLITHKSPTGDTEFFSTICRDIRERQKAEMREKALQAQLHHADKMTALGKFVAGIAHEINNPLTGILGYAEIIRTSTDLDLCKSDAASIVRETTRCAKIVEQLLAFSRKVDFRREPNDLNRIARTCLDLCSYQLKVDDIDVVFRPAPTLPPVLIDAGRIEQVFINILNNAMDAIKGVNGPRRIVVSTESPDGRVRVRFEDSGSGISKDDLPNIFDPFFTTKEVGRGTGLGLSISYGIVADHGGTISVESEVGQGSVFTVDLPVVSVPTPAEREIFPPEVQEIPSLRILVVDDESSVRVTLSRLLSRMGHDVTPTASVDDAIALLKHRPYDVMIVDLRMPGKDGRVFYEHIQRHRPELLKRFVMSTGDVMSREPLDFVIRTGVWTIQKPYTVKQLFTLIQEVLGERARTS